MILYLCMYESCKLIWKWGLRIVWLIRHRLVDKSSARGQYKVGNNDDADDDDDDDDGGEWWWWWW
jgi:hypothetical protein